MKSSNSDTPPRTSSSSQEEENVEELVNFNQIRSSFLPFNKLVKSIKSQIQLQHLVLLKKTPFWKIFKTIFDEKIATESFRKSNATICTIISSFDIETNKFRIGGRLLDIEEEQIETIFGLECGEEVFSISQKNRQETAFVKRYFGKGKKLTKVLIEKAIKKAINGKQTRDQKDFVKLLCLHICCTLLFPNKGSKLAWFFVNYVEKFEKIGTFNWAKAVKAFLLKSIQKYYASPMKVIGCVMLLPVRYKCVNCYFSFHSHLSN